MINFIKSLLPRLLGLVAYTFAMVSKLFLAMSFSLHKLFNTEMGKKIRKYDEMMKHLKEATEAIEKLEKQTQNPNTPKRKSIIPMGADPKLVKILGKGSDDDGSNNKG